MKNQLTPNTPISLTLALTALAALPTQAGSQSGWEEHPIRFPSELFIGTPEGTVRLPNLDRSQTPTLTIKAPAGTRKISRGKPVTSSDDLPIIGDLEMITDGDKDGADGSYVELGPELQWVQIDLEDEHEIYGIVCWHYHKNARVYLDVVIQISSDPAFKEGVTTVYNNDHDNSSGLGKGKDKTWIETNHGRIIQPEGKAARYVRLYSRGNTSNEMNHYVEVEVYGVSLREGGKVGR